MQVSIANLSLNELRKLRHFMDTVCTDDETAAIATLSSADWDLDTAVLNHTLRMTAPESNEDVEDDFEDVEDDSDSKNSEDSESEDVKNGSEDVEDVSESEDSEDVECDSAFEDVPSLSPKPIGSLFPSVFDDVTMAIEIFSEEYEKRFGSNLPFFKGSLRDALKSAKEYRRPLLMMVMNDYSVAQNVFCCNVLGNQNIQDTIKSNFVLFGWDATKDYHMERLCEDMEEKNMDDMAELLRVFTRTQVETFPLLIPVIRKKQDMPSFIQSSDTVDGVLAKLILASEEHRMLNKSFNELRREREERDLIRRLQEHEYHVSLAADLAKIEKIKLEAAEKKMAEEKRKKELEEEERIKNEELARQEGVAKELPSEPAATETGIMTVKFRLPEGKQLMRRFRQAETIRTLVQYLDSQGYSSEKYKYFNSDFPKKNVLEKFDSAHSFMDAKWPVREQIFVEEI